MIDPDAPEARQWLREELAKAPYQAARPTWFDRLSKAVLDWLGGLTAPSEGLVAPWVPLVVTVLIVAALVAAYLIFGPPRLARRAPTPTGLFGTGDLRGAEDLRRSAEAAAAVGNWTLAAQEMFRALARGLAERSVLLVTPGTTAHAFAVRAADAFPERAAHLAEAADSFDRVRYLGDPGTEAEYLQVRDLERGLRGRRPGRLDALAEQAAR